MQTEGCTMPNWNLGVNSRKSTSWKYHGVEAFRVKYAVYLYLGIVYYQQIFSFNHLRCEHTGLEKRVISEGR